MIALAFSDDGTHLASSGKNGEVSLWNLAQPSAAPTALKTGDVPVNSLDFNGTTLASSGFGVDGIQLWQVDDADAAPTVISGAGEFGYRVLFSEDGRQFASGSGMGVYLWDLGPSGEPRVLHGQGAISFAFSPDMRLLASGGRSGDNTIRVWHWNNLDTPPTILRGHKGAVNSLAFSDDGDRLLSASWNGNSILLWNVTDPDRAPVNVPVPERFIPWTAHFSPHAQSVLASGSGGVFAFGLADLDAKPKIVVESPRWAGGLAMSPNRKLLAVANSGLAVYVKDLVQPERPIVELLGHGGPRGTYSVAFSPDGRQLVSGGRSDGSVRLWSLERPDTPSVVLGRHDGAVLRVRFSPHGQWVPSASSDESVRLWNVNEPGGLPIVLSGHRTGVWALEFSKDGRYLVSGASKTIRIWDLSHPLIISTTRDIAEMICQKVWRNFTLEEWHEFVGVEIPYERTCPNLPIHQSLFEAARQLAKDKDIDGATALLERAVELDPELNLEPREEARRLAESGG